MFTIAPPPRVLLMDLPLSARGPAALGEQTGKAVQERLSKMKDGYDRNDMLWVLYSRFRLCAGLS